MLNWLFTQTPLFLFTQSFWRDEAFSYFLAGKNILEIIILSAKDFTPPLYHIILHFWLRIFGGSEISLRSLSLVFFGATIYLCFIFLENIFKLSPKKSLIYILLFILNPFLIYYAFEARTYSFFAFLVTLSYYSFYTRNKKIYFISTVLGLYTHYFMLFVVISQFLFIRLGTAGSARRSIIFKSLLLFFPWVIFILLTKDLSSSFWIAPTSARTFINLLGIIFTSFESNVTAASLFLLLILVISLFKIRGQRRRQNLQLFSLLILWGIGIPTLVAVISLVKPIFYSRYLVFTPIGLILLLIYSLEQIKYKARILLFTGLLLTSLYYQKMLIENRKKTDFRKIALQIKPSAKISDQIFVTSELDFFTAQYYFPHNKVYIYNKTHQEIPDFTGKVLISPSDIASSLPFYPNRAFLIKRNGEYEIQSLY